MTTAENEEAGWATAKTLAEALPFIQRYDREIVVIKYGGHAMGEEEVARQFAADAVLLKLLGLHPVVVHGGGPQISSMLDRAGVKSTFVDGLRVTDAATMEVAEMVLSGAISKEIANWITQAGREADVRGVGLSGKDGRLITVTKARRMKDGEAIDLGFVGEPRHVDPQLIEALIHAEHDYVPVIAPIGVSENGETYNINADTVAGAVAGALKAKRMLLLTDVRGVLGADGELIREMTVAQAFDAIKAGVATGGMIPKLETAIAAVDAGVEAVVILDGRRPHAMLTELFTPHGAGTLIPQMTAGADLRHIDVWLFDIDDTLYPGDNGLMVEIRQRIADYLVQLTGKPEDEVKLIQRGWFETHGAALPGLLASYDVGPETFLDYVHDLPLHQLSPNAPLEQAVARLPGRVLAFTNGSANHAERVLEKLGLAPRFEGVFHIQSGDLTPKPHPSAFDRMIATFGIDPKATCFFEDSSKNLVHAHALGMTTVLVGREDAGEAHIDYVTGDLVAFLNTARVKEPT